MAVHLDPAERRLAGEAIVQHLTRHALHPRAVAVGQQQVQLLAELPGRIELVQGIVIACKRVASDAINRAPGTSLWIMGGRLVPLEEPDRVDRVLSDLLALADQDAWTWVSDAAEFA